ncbi:MAG TPA: hypothetical protein VGD06_01110 [Acidobacteriota bacterium]
MGADRTPYTESLPPSVTCPFCGGRDTRPLATFGSLLMTSQYYCDACRTPFEWLRRESVEPRRREPNRARGREPDEAREREPDGAWGREPEGAQGKQPDSGDDRRPGKRGATAGERRAKARAGDS